MGSSFREVHLLAVSNGHSKRGYSIPPFCSVYTHLLLDKVWGDHVFIEERTVDVHVKRLRESLGDASCMVETVRGAGYRLTVQGKPVMAA